MNSPALSQLSAQDAQQARHLLEAIFYHEQPLLSELQDPHFRIIATLLSEISSPKMKSQLINAIPQHQHERIFEHCSVHLKEQLLSCPLADPIKSTIFQHIPNEQQDRILNKLYHENSALYSLLKPNPTPYEASSNELKQLQSKLLQKIQHPQYSHQQLQQEAEQLHHRYQEQDSKGLIQALTQTFSQLKLPLQSPQQFNIYLKFFTLISPFIAPFPTLQKHLQPVTHHLILALHQFPSIDWIIKVLNQLPAPIINVILKELLHYDQFQQKEKQEIFIQVLKKIQPQLQHPNAQKINDCYQSLRP